MLSDKSAIEGDWLVALAQDAGRGRQGRQWVSDQGNFFGSTLVELMPSDPPAPSLSLASGLALVEALDAAAPAERTMLKWPNDVLLDGRKLAGILLERSADRLVAGFGVNLASAPDLPDRPTASLGGGLTPQAFAPLLAASFARLLSLWRLAEWGAIARAWSERAHPVGSSLTVQLGPGETVEGRFDGVDPDGALRLLLADGQVQTVRAGDVHIF